MPSEIFASYSREDQAQVFPIVDKLRDRGLNIWIDQEGIHGAKLWSQEIVNAIESSKVFILFASAKAFVSKNVTKELALASESDKHILPIFIEEAEIPPAMKYQLAGIQHLVHEQGQTEQTADNILRTLGNLDIQSTEPQPAAATRPTAVTKPASKTPLVAACLVIALAVIAFLLFRGDSAQKTSTPSATTKTYKSTIDLCVVTISEDGEGRKVSKENRELRDELSAKLARFSDYKVIRGETLSPDATTQDFLELAEKVNADFILQAAIDSDQKRFNTLLFDGNDGRNFWTKSLTDKDIDISNGFVDEATGIVAAHIAGHDGAIHRNLLKKALVKKEEELTPMELLQLGKSLWEETTKDKVMKAIEHLEKCIELNPEISTAYAVLSEVYLHDIRGEYNQIPDALQKAKEASRRSIQLDSNNALAWIEKTYITRYEKDFTAFEVEAKKALELNPFEPLVLISAGQFYISTDINPDLGKKYIDDAFKYNPHPQAWYYNGLSSYYLGKGDYQMALKTWLESGAKDDESAIDSAILYWLNDNKISALRYFKTFKTLRPEYSLSNYEKLQEVWGASENRKSIRKKAFKEIAEAYENSKK